MMSNYELVFTPKLFALYIFRCGTHAQTFSFPHLLEGPVIDILSIDHIIKQNYPSVHVTYVQVITTQITYNRHEGLADKKNIHPLRAFYTLTKKLTRKENYKRYLIDF